MWYAGHGHPVASLLLKPHPWSRTDLIGYVGTAGGQVTLEDIEPRHLSTTTGEVGGHSSNCLWDFYDFTAEIFGK
jgi:hypothetical protein